MTIVLSARWVVRGLSAGVLVLALAQAVVVVARHGFDHTRLFGLARLFDLDLEANVPSWFSSMALLAAAALLGAIGAAARQARARYARHWIALAVIFTGLSLDEVAGLHDLMIRPVSRALRTGGMLTFAWVVPGAVFLAVVGLAYLRFVRDLPPATQRGVLVAAALYVGGAFGLELVGGGIAARAGMQSLGYSLAATAEELLEMIGAVVFVRTLASHALRHLPDLRLRLDP